jgi:hypothetical protein
MQPTTIAVPTTLAAGAGVAIAAAVTGGYMLNLSIRRLTAASGTPRARIVFEDSVDDFTASVPVAVVDVVGPIESPINFSWNNDHIPNLRIGTESAKLRASVVMLEGTSPTLAADAYLSR